MKTTDVKDYIDYYVKIYPNNREHCLNVLSNIYPELTREELIRLIKLYKDEQK